MVMSCRLFLKALVLSLVALLLYGCAETNDETHIGSYNQDEPMYYPQEYEEENEPIDIITVLLHPVYHTREDAIQFAPFRFERYEHRPRHDRNELIAEEGTFDYRQFFTLIEGTLSEEELEDILAGETTVYKMLQGQPRIGSRSRVDSAVIVETKNGDYMIVSFSHAPGHTFGGNNYGVGFNQFVDAFTLEDILRNLGVEEKIYETSLDLESTRVFLLSNLPPISHTSFGFLFSDGENEYFLAPNDWVYDPMGFPVADFFLPEELGYFTMYAGVFYATSEVLPFLLDRREVQAKAYERYRESVGVCESCGFIISWCMCAWELERLEAQT